MYRFLVSEAIWGWTEIELFDQLVLHFRRRGLDIVRERVKRWEARSGHFGRRRRWEVEAACAIVVNDRTGEYSILDCGDRVVDRDPKLLPVLSDPRCRLYLKAQYRGSAYDRAPFAKVRPWIYIEQTPGFLQARLKHYRNVPRSRRELYFRGRIDHSYRHEILGHLRQRGVLSPDPQSVSIEEYIDEMSQHRLALSLPGHGNLCHREIEAFAIGTPVLMPVLRNSLHDPLVPDVHYIAADIDTESASREEVARRLCDRYNQVIDEQPLLERTAGQAIEWYERNARFPACLELTGRLLGVLEPAIGSASAPIDEA